MLKYHIQTIQISTATPTITFSNIPQIYSDLLIVVSDRSDRSGAVNDAVMLRCNGTNVTGRRLFGSGSSATSTADFAGINVAGNATANTFSNMAFYISNYSSSTTTKLVSLEAVGENNATAAYQSIAAGLFNSLSPVTSIQLYQETGTNFVQYSSASLYGIRRGSDGRTEVASGGTITTSGGYTIHTFNSSGTFVANRDMDVEYLVIGGGGAGAAGGGGAGGYRCSVVGESSGGGASAEAKLRLSTGTSYSVIVGAGSSGISWTSNASNGSASSFANILSLGGGGGGGNTISPPTGGGSGGGAFVQSSAGTTVNGAAGTANQGYAGGSGTDIGDSPNYFGSGGGGGASAVGGNGSTNTSAGTSVGGNGGNGVSSSITGSAVTRAGGGGGCNEGNTTGGLGGSGGGGNGRIVSTAAQSATANTGSGGGGTHATGTGGNGGSGVVIIRYLTPA